MARNAFAAITVVWVAALGSLTACGTGSINGPVSVGPGQQTNQDVTTVNGAVTVGDGAKIKGATTVNGSITFGSNVTAESAKTVNGAVKIGESTHVSGPVLTVNGEVTLAKSADVQGKVANVNGAIHLASAHVGGGIGTVAGDIDVGSGSRVEGGIHVESSTFNSSMKVPRIVIGPDAVVQGTLKFDHEVKLYVSDTATIGPVEGATPEKFSGDQPPQ